MTYFGEKKSGNMEEKQQKIYILTYTTKNNKVFTFIVNFELVGWLII